MAPVLKLTYFGIPGRGELSRLLFAFGGVAFEDARVSGPEFGAMKADLPLGQLPILEVDGVVFSQSMAISRYAAKLAGLYPADAEEALRVEMISETLVDILNVMVDIKFRTSDEALKAEKAAKFVSETLPKSLGALDAMVQGKFFLGENATLADVHLFDIVHNGLKSGFADFDFSKYTKLEGVVEAVKSNTNTATYLSKA